MLREIHLKLKRFVRIERPRRSVDFDYPPSHGKKKKLLEFKQELKN